MRVFEGQSFHLDAASAVAEATSECAPDPSIVFAFSSTSQDTFEVSRALNQRFPGSVIAGCSTAGEYLRGQHSRGSLAVAAVYDAPMTWASRNIADVASLTEQQAQIHVRELLAEHGVRPDTFAASQYVALLLIDGVSLAEERAAAILADVLDGIPLAGGSAGDDLRFEQTAVFSDKGCLRGGAVLVLAQRGSVELQLIKHQHFSSTDQLLCVTAADADQRIVYELDGLPAADAYAAALGVRASELTDDLTFLNPLSLLHDNETYVRSVRAINPDGSLTFYCGIDTGMVLDIARHGDLPTGLEAELRARKGNAGKFDLVIGFNCVLRALEAERCHADSALTRSFQNFSKATIGFATYGEQLNGLHINQTMVALALRDTHGAAS